MFWGFFDASLFQPLNDDKYLSILKFVNCYCLKIASKTCNNSKFNKEPEIFENWVVDGTQYVFHKNWFYQQNFSNLRISEPPSNKI